MTFTQLPGFTTGSGWQEAVTSVGDLDRWIDALRTLAGWTLVQRGVADRRLLSAWHLPAEAQASEAVLVCEQEPARWLRLMCFTGVPQVQIRSSGQAWDTGGLFSILIYAADTQAAFERAQALGWSAHHDPVVMDFGGRQLLNVVLRGPDGCNFGLYQPLGPTAAQPSTYARLGAPFTGQQMVSSLAASERFYQQALGWESWYSGETRLTCNNFGIPANMVGVHPKQVAIMHAQPDQHGQVELVEWAGFVGRDFADRALPPNLGHLALRWPVTNLADHLSRLRRCGVTPFSEPFTCTLAPLGEVLLCTVRTPDGTLIDLVQAMWNTRSEH